MDCFVFLPAVSFAKPVPTFVRPLNVLWRSDVRIELENSQDLSNMAFWREYRMIPILLPAMIVAILQSRRQLNGHGKGGQVTAYPEPFKVTTQS